jgi:hypothetical protein
MATMDIATLGIAVDSSSVTNADRALVSLSNTAARVTGTIKTLVGAWAGWHVVKSIIIESAQLNARFETMGIVMNIVGRNAGYSAGQMAEYEKALRKTGIAMIESREVLTRMAQAQLDLSKTSELARIAQDAAVVGGINSSAAFERMVQGIQQGEVEILRGIGLTVNFQQAYNKLAEELKKNVSTLTETEKTQARMNAVMEEGKNIAGVYEAAMGTAGKQMSSMKRYVDDLKVKFGELFNETLTISIFAFSDGLKGANRELDEMAASKEIHKWGEDLTDVFVGLANAIHNTWVRFSIIYKATELGVGGIKDFFTSSTQKEFDKKAGGRYDAWEKQFNADVMKGDAFIHALEDRRKAKAKDAYLGVGTFGGADLLRQSKVLGISSKGDQAKLLSAQDADFYMGKGASVSPAPKGTKGAAVDKVKSFIAALKEEVATLGMSEEAHKRYDAAQLKMSTSQRKITDSLLMSLEEKKQRIAGEESAIRANNEAWDAAFDVQERMRLSTEEAIKTQRVWLESVSLEASLLGKTNEEREIAIRLLDLQKGGIQDPAMSGKISSAVYAKAGNEYTQAALTQEERLLEERERVEKIYQNGGFGSPESEGAMIRYSNAVGVVNEKYRSLGDTVQKANTLGRDLGLTFTSAFEKAMVSGSNLRGVLQGLVADLQAMLIRKSITEPLLGKISGPLGGLDFGSLFGSSAPSNIAAFSSMPFGSISAFSTAFADGGVMTSRGRLPLRTYSFGGVANSPQASVFGEGSTPEAYVPVPSGKIPVEMKGGGGPTVTITQSFDFRIFLATHALLKYPFSPVNGSIC